MALRRRIRLGYLERSLLEWLWTRGWVDVATAHAEVGRRRGLARNTLHSTLERLVRKGLAERERRGRAHVYRVCVSQDAWVRRALGESVEHIPGANPRLILASFVDLAERMDEAGLEELERLVRARLHARGPGGGTDGGDGGDPS